MSDPDFGDLFQALTGHSPFPWQRRLFERMVAGNLPSACDIPTGLGKTSVMVIWLIAAAEQARTGKVTLPRRLVYVVDRRTVVDQSTDVAMRIRDAIVEGHVPALADGLCKLAGERGDLKELLAISTLRGEFADNRMWQDDPARAAIIVGTVDMIGSRLLFSGYGVSRKMRPFHAGLLGQDTLIVHDEAHLSPAFGKLIRDIAALQQRADEPRPVRVMELSATQRGYETGEPFHLLDSEKEEGPVKQRLRAPKSLRWHDAGKDGKVAEALAAAAAGYENAKVRVVVYVRSPKTAIQVAGILDKQKKIDVGRIAVLTGTIRGHERDALVKSPLFDGFRAKPDGDPPPQTHYLIATSAGEVGIDLDADHMVSDLTTLDSMIQRLGRVNRLGEGHADIMVVDVPPEKEKGSDAEDASDYEKRTTATRDALRSLSLRDDGSHDASPAALRELVDRLSADDRNACFSKKPTMVDLSDILLDGWAMTRLKVLPGRPPVDRWLRGITSEPPSVHVAWREEVGEMVALDDVQAALKTLFDKHRVRANERLGAPLREDTIAELTKIAKRLGPRKVILLPDHGDRETDKLENLVRKESRDRLREATIVLPPDAGGLDRQGMLDGSATDRVEDVADRPPGQRADSGDKDTRQDRVRVLVARDAETAEWSARRLDTWDALPFGDAITAMSKTSQVVTRVRKVLRTFAEIGRIDLGEDSDTGQPERLLLLLADPKAVQTVAENPAAAAGRQSVDDHVAAVRREVEGIIARIGVNNPVLTTQIAEAVAIAAWWHDRGKDRDPWQADIGNPRPRGGGDFVPLAKSGRRGFVSRLSGEYRHEFGSLREASTDEAIAAHPERDLILHLIAAHHGWARPHFEDGHWDIAEDVSDEDNAAVAADTLRRFARLQRRFGRWGLAWLESLLRAADYRVSRGVVAEEEPA